MTANHELRAERDRLWTILQANGGRGIAEAERIDQIDAILDWRHEVANDETVLGFAEWLLHRREAEGVFEDAGEPSFEIGTWPS